jgi:hypothetical protein
MSGPLEQLTAEAHRLMAAGDLAAAERTLADALADTNGNPTAASPAIADAAGLLAHVLVALGEPESARGWAAYAHTANRRLHGPDDGRTVRAAATLAAVLHRVGAHARAARLYREVIHRLSTMEGEHGADTIAARADLATVLHARGECAEARALLAEVWEDHRAVYGDGHPAGIKMLARLGAMARDCGDLTAASRYFADVRALSRARLPADHPMVAQIEALAAAAPAPGHTCREAPNPPGTDPTPSESGGQGGDPSPTPSKSGDDGDGRDAGSRHRRRVPIAIAAIVGLLVAAGVAIAARRGSDAPSRTAAPATTSQATSASQGVTTSPAASPKRASSSAPAPAPPTGLTLNDGRDHVALRWTYPDGAHGAVMISGGRKGQPRHVFQRLAAGTTTYTVYGLADRFDYCFSVAVAFPAGVALSSAPVCTARAAARSP